MAKLDDLIGHVADEKLQGELSRAVGDMRRQKQFGLVFEEHIPEVTLLRGFPIRPGMIVHRKDDTDAREPLRVTAVTGTKVSLQAPNSNKTIRLAASQLLVLRRFGDAVYPALVPDGAVVRGGGKPYHAVIDGENFHALQLLSFLYEGQVDCMYLDPPYNTGATDWKYNNDYVDLNDTWRHSKWLSMMEKRLSLAKRLLKSDGVVVLMIDEHELHHLGVLLEQLFPGYLHYMVSIVINSRGSTGTRNFGVVEEQALFLVPDVGYDLITSRETYVPDLAGRIDENRAEDLLRRAVEAIPDLARRIGVDGDTLDDHEEALLNQLAEQEHEQPAVADDGVPGEYWRGAVRTGQGTSYRRQRKKQFYALYLDEATNQILRVGEPLLDVDDDGTLAGPSWDPVDGLTPIWPVDEEEQERVWCYEPGRMREEIAAGNIQVGRFNSQRGTYAVNVRRVRRTAHRFREITVWWDPSYDAGSNGTNILRTLLGRSGAFPFPKSVYAVRDVLATIVGDRPDALILDFFAGSGTTLHATALLNAADGGDRRTIMVTNNEVDPVNGAQLNARGYYPGDARYDQHGIYQAVTKPRVRAAIEGLRADGSPIPGRHKWAQGRPFADGFDENCAFFRLGYLDPDEIELGQQFAAILPSLWLAAGGIGPMPAPDVAQGYLLPDESPFAVLLSETAFRQFAAALETRADISHVWFVTDSVRAFTDMRATLPGRYQTAMLYRDFLRNFTTRMDSGE